MISWCVNGFVSNSDFRLGDTRPRRDCHDGGGGWGCPADFSLHVGVVALC